MPVPNADSASDAVTVVTFRRAPGLPPVASRDIVAEPPVANEPNDQVEKSPSLKTTAAFELPDASASPNAIAMPMRFTRSPLRDVRRATLAQGIGGSQPARVGGRNGAPLGYARRSRKRRAASQPIAS